MKKIAVILLFIILISGCVEQESVYVSKIIDGDTFETSEGEKIRLLGINAPEKNEYYYEESTQMLKQLIESKYVTLEKDQTDQDWYGRKLRYVYIGNEFVNSKMLEQGYARLYLLHDKKYENTFRYAENHAKDSHIGVWS